MPKRRVKVLCFYKYWARVYGSTQEHTDSIMIDVERSDEIRSRFEEQMRIRVSMWTSEFVGPRPQCYRIQGWMAENGRRVF